MDDNGERDKGCAQAASPLYSHTSHEDVSQTKFSSKLGTNERIEVVCYRRLSELIPKHERKGIEMVDSRLFAIPKPET